MRGLIEKAGLLMVTLAAAHLSFAAPQLAHAASEKRIEATQQKRGWRDSRPMRWIAVGGRAVLRNAAPILQTTVTVGSAILMHKGIIGPTSHVAITALANAPTVVKACRYRTRTDGDRTAYIASRARQSKINHFLQHEGTFLSIFAAGFSLVASLDGITTTLSRLAQVCSSAITGFGSKYVDSHLARGNEGIERENKRLEQQEQLFKTIYKVTD